MIKRKITSRYRITLPREVKDKIGFKEGDKLVFTTLEGKILISKAKVLH